MRTAPNIRKRSSSAVDFVARVDPRDIERINRSLRALPGKARKGIYAKAFRLWGRSVVSTAKAFTPKRRGLLRKSISVRIRRYRSAVWAAVGAKVQKRSAFRLDQIITRRERFGIDFLGAGWRAHLTERGHTPGGLIRKGKRKGQSTKAKSRVPGRGMLFKAGTAHASKLAPLVQQAVDAAIRQEGFR
jgi:hypothetical protein